MTKITAREIEEVFEKIGLRHKIAEREQRIAEAKERIVEVARVWATGFSGGSFNLIDAVRELEEAEK